MREIATLLVALLALLSTPVLAENLPAPEIEVIALVAHPSDVDNGNPTRWPAINVDPYRGNVNDASVILSRMTDIRPLERQEAWAMRTRGECHAYQLKPGDVTRTTFGKDRTMLAEVGFTGMADICIIRSDNTAVVFPRGCANIGDALAIVKVTINLPPAPEPRQVESVPPRGTTINQQVIKGSSQDGPTMVFVTVPARGGRYIGETNIDNSSASVAESNAISDGTSTATSSAGAAANAAATSGSGCCQ